MIDRRLPALRAALGFLRLPPRAAELRLPYRWLDPTRAIHDIVVGVGFVVALLTGCATVTPERSAALKDAQQFVDEVTTAYGVGHIRVTLWGSGSGYHGGADVLTLQPPYLGRDDQRVVLAALLGPPTLKLRTATPASVLAGNRQGVKIMMQFLGMSEREAIDRLAALLVENREALREGERRLPTKDWRAVWWSDRQHLHPCEQLRALWASYSLADSQPPCDPAFR